MVRGFALLSVALILFVAGAAQAADPCVTVCADLGDGDPCNAICGDPVCSLDPGLQTLEIRAPGRCASNATCYEAVNGDVPDRLWDWVFERACFAQSPSVHRPTAARPFVVEFGPGTFTMRDTIVCQGPGDEGHVTWRGAGSLATTLLGNPVFSAADCEDLGVEDLSMVGDGSEYSGLHGATDSGYDYVTEWGGSGSSVWRNVEVRVDGTPGNTTANAWYDLGCEGTHYFYNTVWLARDADFASSFVTDCTDLWFYNSEIRAEALPGTQQVVGLHAVHVDPAEGKPAAIRAIGSALRVVTDRLPPADVFESVAGNGVSVVIAHGGEFHAHGSVLQVDASAASPTAAPVAGFVVADGATVHVIDSAFDLRPPSGGKVRRFQQDLIFPIPGEPPPEYRSPYLWSSGPDEPNAPISLENQGASADLVDGRDEFVDTDCQPAGSGGLCTGGTEPHLMIYESACVGGSGDQTPWLDVVTGACRR